MSGEQLPLAFPQQDGTAVTFHDAGPGSLGRRHFTLTWEDTGGVFRPELSRDGRPVGYRRGQCFFAVPESFVPAVAEVAA